MRKLLLSLALGLPWIGACSPQGSPVAATLAGPSPAPALTREEVARRFFETGAASVPEGGSPDTGFAALSAGTSPSMGLGVRLMPVPGYPGVFNVVLRNTGSGYQESFVLQIPANPPPGPRPLLVAFHRYGVSHADAFFWTSFPQECQQRGWYFVAPLGGSQKHFSSLVSQINTQRVLELVRAFYPIDAQRIYGVGFSMGGGAAATYAARHLADGSPRFAAVVNHTGTVSLANAFANEADDNDADDGPLPTGANLEAPDMMEFWNGGTPAQSAFAYQRCSTIDIDPLTGLVQPGTDLARNLGHLEVMTWVASGDTNPYLPAQTQTWVGHLIALGVNSQFVTANFNGHSWDALDETAVCNWLAPLSFVEPSSGNQLVDEDGQRVFHFRVEQQQTGAFTPFQWQADVPANRLQLSGAANLKRISVDAAKLGLGYQGCLSLQHSNQDASQDEIVFTHVPWAPLAIVRDGQPATGVYDAQAGTLQITEVDGAGHLWQIYF